MLGGNGAALRCRRRRGNRALVRITEDRPGDRRPIVSGSVPTTGSTGTSFGVESRLELVIPSRLLEQVFYGGRCIVFRRAVDANDALILAEAVSRTQLQPCNTVPIDGDEMQPIVRDLHDQLLRGTAVSATEQQGLTAFFGQHVRTS